MQMSFGRRDKHSSTHNVFVFARVWNHGVKEGQLSDDLLDAPTPHAT